MEQIVLAELLQHGPEEHSNADLIVHDQDGRFAHDLVIDPRDVSSQP